MTGFYTLVTGTMTVPTRPYGDQSESGRADVEKSYRPNKQISVLSRSLGPFSPICEQCVGRRENNCIANQITHKQIDRRSIVVSQ